MVIALAAPVAIRRVRPLVGHPRVRFFVRPRGEWGTASPSIARGSNHLSFILPGGTLRLNSNAPLAYLLDHTWFSLQSPVSLMLGPDETLSSGIEETARDFEEQTLLYWRHWTRRLALPLEWQEAVIRSAITLKLCQFEETGAIADVADGAKELTGGDRTAELLGIVWIGGFGSALVDNIPFTTAMIPVVSELQAGTGGDDAYWWALSLGACFGGNATLIAAAANVAAAGLTERAGRPIGFIAFMRVGVPVTIVSLIMASVYILIRYIALN